jgi:hypothetical protein
MIDVTTKFTMKMAKISQAKKATFRLIPILVSSFGHLV